MLDQLRHLMERFVRDKRVLKEIGAAKDAKSLINQDTRKAMIYIQITAEKNLRVGKAADVVLQ